MAIARKIVVSANDEGLVLQPAPSKSQRPLPPLLIKYGDASVSSTPRDGVVDSASPSSFEAFGVIGLMSVFKQSYLITITRREQVAQIRGFPIYVVTGVAITPCSSYAEAKSAIAETIQSSGTEPADKAENDKDALEDEEEALSRVSDEVEDVIDDPSADPGLVMSEEKVTSSVAEDVIRRQGSFGRFAERWFSKKGWVLDQKRTMGLSRPALEQPAFATTAGGEGSRDSEDSLESTASTLLPKLLHTARILFGSSRSFYFSYDFDITRRWGECKPFSPDLPLHAQVAPVYFWNSHLLKPLISAGAESVALPLMQGYVGQKSFIMDRDPPQVDDSEPEAMEMSSFLFGGSGPTSPPNEEAKEIPERRQSEQDFLVTLISRRSTKRAGLRYLRRGIDEDGHTANTVETEQILSTPWWNSSSPTGSKIYSFIQVRGSIPVFFTQSPNSFKPVPVLQQSQDANLTAMKKHFDELHESYGSIHLINLVEKHNTEAIVGEAYSRQVSKLNEDLPEGEKMPFEWFDFHAVCRGMKFENVSLLLDQIRGDLDRYGSTVEADGKVLRRQTGTLRTNCMDCLDRTNVCQSLFAKYMLEAQLRGEGFDMSAQVDQNSWWFNNIWADNGDAVSNQYASTAAMKGDYTRTRKRDYRGTLNDLGLSLTRFYNGQLAIDFLLGNVTALVFSEFEANLITKDPAISVFKKREQAIQLCQSRVIADDSEKFVAGWAILTPQVSGAVNSQPLDEAVLLLTDCAMYLCRFNWDLDRVLSFERVDLRNVVGIKVGTYITSTVSSVHMDKAKNIGCVVSYQPGKDDFTRTNTRTLSSLGNQRKTHRTTPDAGGGGVGPFAVFFSGRSRGANPPVKRIALKMPYSRSSLAKDGAEPRQTEVQLVHTICSEIERLAGQAQGRPEDEDWGIIEEEDIISLDEAKRSTGILDQLGHSLKRMVWA
ncbi:related to SAC1 - recessive suppressor of secretory defect [Cephalotrichum gorgonifer]|uniref:Related to SAC1 - recessive suppressor of secretory defect n=1 Tax=Cephalotrichum gorgonifer TaxID=2041049 RepID=A0AAE8SRT9_9PEZI|nr:related to SAC1 - recessive suppressor of secretory defect [Cephalotrichum gorgonifer]